MKAYLIDPEAERITEVTYNGDWRTIAPAINARLFDVVSLDYDTGDAVFVDDEGMLTNPTHFFLIDGYPQPIAGRGLVLGTDDEGESVAPRLTIEEVKERISFPGISEILAMFG